MFNLRKHLRKPQYRQLSPEEQDSIATIYNSPSWKALMQDFQNQKADLTDDLLNVWYSSPATEEGMYTASISSVAIVSRIRALEEKMADFKTRFENDEPIPISVSPKTIDQYL